MGEIDSATSQRAVRNRLETLHLHLQIVHAGVVVSAAALQHQRAERDEEIARVLTYFVGERLFHQIERIAELIESLQPLPADRSEISWDLERSTDR